MIICQSCGQSNNDLSVFCRFCGERFAQMEKKTQTDDFTPPRPYAWKTDELEVNRAKQRKTEEFSLKDGTSNTAPVQKNPFQTEQLVYQKPYGVVANSGCPRCSTQLTPRFERRISNAGWIVFAVLLITFFPLFWIGFLIKEDVPICPVCQYRYK